MNTPLHRLAEVENKLFQQYMDIMNENEPETVQTEHGEFDNREWLEAEADMICDEKHRVKETTDGSGKLIGAEH